MKSKAESGLDKIKRMSESDGGENEEKGRKLAGEDKENIRKWWW